MVEHTPGPWQLRYGSNGTMNIVDDGKPKLCIATVHYRTSGGANARLIAAAPDMLEALEALIEGSDPDGIPDGIHADACAAIEKARGE